MAVETGRRKRVYHRHGDKQTPDEGLFPATSSEWMLLYRLSRKHTVQGIVYDGICTLPVGCQPPKMLLIQWAVEIDKWERINHHQQQMLCRIQMLFNQAPAIPFELIKGLAISCYYPNPLHRVCGDLDLYFAPEQRPVYFGIPICVPTPVAHQMLVSTHILKHLLNEGIGLRQLCDAAILLKAQASVLDKEELAKRCHQFGIYRWSKLLYALLVKYIGLPAEYLPFPTDENPDTLMEEVWESGNFGFYDERKAARPDGKWKNKWYTVKQISRKAKLFFLYAPGETFWWPVSLSGVRLKELIQGK